MTARTSWPMTGPMTGPTSGPTSGPISRRSTRRWLTLVVLLLALGLGAGGCKFDGAYDLPLPGKQVSEEDGYDVTAEFADVLDVVPRSPVMVDDVPVGQVLDVERVGWHARVKMRIRNDIQLPADADAEIRQTSLLGEKYVALLKPAGVTKVSGARLGQGDVIALDSTDRNPEVEEVLGALSMLLSGGGIGQLKSISNELNQLMTGRTGELREVLDRVTDLVSTLDDQKGDIIAAMESVNKLSITLVNEKQTIGNALDSMGPALKVLSAQHDNLVSMLTELDKLGTVGSRVINRTKDDLIAELKHLEPVMRRLADTGKDLVPGVTAALSYPFPLKAADAIKGDYANVIFKLQIKLTPVSQGGLIPSNLQELSQVCKATPLAPICVQADQGIEQLCSALPSLPLCASATSRAEADNALRRLNLGAATAPGAAPSTTLPSPNPAPTTRAPAAPPGTSPTAPTGPAAAPPNPVEDWFRNLFGMGGR